MTLYRVLNIYSLLNDCINKYEIQFEWEGILSEQLFVRDVRSKSCSLSSILLVCLETTIKISYFIEFGFTLKELKRDLSDRLVSTPLSVG